MCSRYVELVALGPELRELAQRRGEGVNEAHLLVHQIMAEAFADPHRLPSEGLREHLSAQMECRLDGRRSQTPRKSRVAWPRAMWRRAGSEQQTAAPAD